MERMGYEAKIMDQERILAPVPGSRYRPICHDSWENSSIIVIPTVLPYVIDRM